MPPIEHALLSASSAARWIACTPSARLEEPMPDKGSTYAAEGTLAHAVAELKARKKFTPMSTRSFNSEMKKLKEAEGYQEEMQGHTDFYVDYLAAQAMNFPSMPCVAMEVRVDYSEYAPEGFGTSDCIVIGGDTLQVVDFKYGKGEPVSAEENPQMMCYALGALAKYAPIYGDAIKRIRMAIIQPRLDSISEWELPRMALELWGEEILKPAAQKAWAGEGECVEGDHCRFCRAKAVCRARANRNTALEDFAFALPPTLSNKEVGEILIRAQRLKAWVSDLEEYALGACLKGEEVPGWKLVEGRSLRQFSDADAALTAIINAGTPQEMLYDYKPKTLAQVEKLLGAKAFEEAAGSYVIKPPGKPTLVPLEDKRPAYSPAAADFAGVVEP
jgi:hypothetical protein